MTQLDDIDILRRAAHLSGVELGDVAAIRVGAHGIYRLAGDVVARIGQPDTYDAASRELRLATWLNHSGISAANPISRYAQPVTIDDRPVTWWHLIPPHRQATPAELGATLAALHRLAPPTDVSLPEYDPFAGLDRRIADAPNLDEDSRDWLLDHVVTLRARYSQASTRTVVHGDAWQGNLVVPEQGAVTPILLDLDRMSLGDPAWDLIQLAVDHEDFDRLNHAEYQAFVDAYGGYDVRSAQRFRLYADIQELRWTTFAAGLNSPTARQQARHRVECLQGKHPKPWTWTAL